MGIYRDDERIIIDKNLIGVYVSVKFYDNCSTWYGTVLSYNSEFRALILDRLGDGFGYEIINLDDIYEHKVNIYYHYAQDDYKIDVPRLEAMKDMVYENYCKKQGI